MRVLSFIPAFLLAAASFVAAAPTDAATNCVAPSAGGSGNDAALQPVIAIITNATTHLQPYGGQLTDLKGDACTPDAISNIVIEVKAVVDLCVSQLQAAVKVDLSLVFVGNLVAAIYALLTVVLEIVTALVAIIVSLKASVVLQIKDIVCALLDVLVKLVLALEAYVVVNVTGVLGAVILTVKGALNLCLAIVLKADVFLGVN